MLIACGSYEGSFHAASPFRLVELVRFESRPDCRGDIVSRSGDQRGVRTGSRARVFVAALAGVAAVVAVLLAAPAGAVTQSYKGKPGAWSLSKVQGSHYNLCERQVYTCFDAWVVGSGPVVYRSPAWRGAQVVGAVYTLSRWDTTTRRWVTQATKTHLVSFGDRNSIRLPRVDFIPTHAGHLRVGIFVGWSTPSDRTLGTRGAVYDDSRDYWCNTRFSSFCRVGDGWVWLRAPGA
jgi:hypothetical protein